MPNTMPKKVEDPTAREKLTTGLYEPGKSEVEIKYIIKKTKPPTNPAIAP